MILNNLPCFAGRSSWSSVSRTPEVDLNQNWKTPKRSVNLKRTELPTSSYEMEENLNSGENYGSEPARSSCKFCKRGVKRAYRLRKHEENCYFKVPTNLANSGVRVTKIRLIDKCEALAAKAKLLSIEDSYEYNSIALLCVPGVFPLVFPGSSHFGRKVPPIIKKTADNKSLNILNKLLALNGEVTLDKHIILVEESSGLEIYLRPQLLIPDNPHLVIKYEDKNKTTLSLHTEQKLEDSSSDESDDDDVEEVLNLSVAVNDLEEHPDTDTNPDDNLLCCDGIYQQEFFSSYCHLFSDESLLFGGFDEASAGT